MSPSPTATATTQLAFGEHQFSFTRPHRFGIVIQGPADCSTNAESQPTDYLHDVLLAPAHKDTLLDLVETEGLVVCKNVATDEPTYRKVRGKTSGGKLSQAEYYHHDGCSCPTKPRVVEIRLPHQEVGRDIATAIAPFTDVILAMLQTLPKNMKADAELARVATAFGSPRDQWPPAATWDKIQGRITRMVRKELDAEACRAYFRTVDQAAGAYVLPWEMGESRLMLNNHVDLSKTMQHRRSLQKPKSELTDNGSLVKRWTAEEYPAVDGACLIGNGE